MTGGDPYDLERFLLAQAQHWDKALAELRDGRKRTHWMWFIFPQLAGLGHSAMARHYGIGSRAEAAAYLAHPVLGARLVEGTERANAVQGRTARDVFGAPDDLKFRSCMTLFARVGDEPAFGEALRLFYGGLEDAATRRLLETR